MNGELRIAGDLVLFAKIVQLGGISRCAAALGMERTTVSRRLAGLERELGVKLLNRTPKRITTTDAGGRCIEYCENIIESVRNATSSATTGKTVVKLEPLVVGAPPDIIDHYLDAKLDEFETRNPQISVTRHPVSSMNEDIFSTVDMLVSWTSPSPTIGLAKKLARIEQSMYASPEYVTKHGCPKSPYDIESHPCIVLASDNENRLSNFTCGSESIDLRIRSRFVVSGLLEARETTMAGLGLSMLPNYFCEPFESVGRLVRVLAEYSTPPRDLLIVSPRREHLKPRATSLLVFLEHAFRQSLVRQKIENTEELSTAT